MHRLIFLSIFVLFNSLLLSPVEAERNSFSIDLIHRDSILSPLDNSSNTLQKNVDVSQFNSSMYVDAKVAQSELSHTSNVYLMEIHISKSYAVLGLASLISDLIWIQCDCNLFCYPQDKPPFEPSKSSTYHSVPHGSKTCTDFGLPEPGDDRECLYDYKSDEDKFSHGVLSTETLYLSSTQSGSPESFPEKLFGCGTKNIMTVPRSVQGVIGLGRGELSLISQLKSKTSGTFSYCLRPGHKNTKLRFGPQPRINAKTAVLDLFQHTEPKLRSSYVLKLKATEVVKGKKFGVSEPYDRVVIDIGKTLTHLHGNVYDELIENFKRVVSKTKVRREEDSTGKFQLCYNEADVLLYGLPDIVFSFSGSMLSGKDLTLTSSHTSGNYDGKRCMTIVRSPLAYSILGSTAQENFRVEYKPWNNKVTFIETECDAHIF